MCLEFGEVKIVMCNRKRISGHKYDETLMRQKPRLKNRMLNMKRQI